MVHWPWAWSPFLLCAPEAGSIVHINRIPHPLALSCLWPIRSTGSRSQCKQRKVLLLLLSRFSRVRLCATPQTAAHQVPPSLGFSRQEHWSGLPLPSPMHESEKWKWSWVWLFVTPWTVAHQAPPSMGFSRREDWSCHCLLPREGDQQEVEQDSMVQALCHVLSLPFVCGKI